MSREFATEKKVMYLYSKNKIALSFYHKLLQKIAERRHKQEILKKKNRRSMSSTKWN